jgi:glycosyltransferase involved in cell wall biosynthesis
MTKSLQAKISIVIPIHNEAVFLRKQIKKLLNQITARKLKNVEIIIVENGSSDKSWKIIQTLGHQFSNIRPMRNSSQSYGQAIKAGILSARAPVVAIFNLDLIDIRFLQKALQLLKVVDIVVASKTLAASRDQRSTFRKLTTYFFNAFLRIVLNYPGTDTHGIKAFTNTRLLRNTLKKCRTKNELLDTELIVRMTRSGALLVELPITVKEIRPTRYHFFHRIYLSTIDFMVALRSKYLENSFESQVTVADDYGISPLVNTAIISSLQQKEVQVVSVLATHVSLSELNKLKKKLGPKNFSLHFNLVRRKAVSPLRKISSLVDSGGYFFPLWLFLLKLLLKQIDLDHVKTELTAQYKFLHKKGVRPHYLDSEQHTHTLEPIAQIVSQFAKKNNLKIRSTQSTSHYLSGKPFRFIVWLMFYTLLRFLYPNNSSSASTYHASICHPGTTFD